MSRKNRSFLVVSLLPLVLLGSVSAAVQAQDAKTPAIKQTLWSDPATWPDRQVPRAGDKVTIERGKDVVLDVSPPPLHGLIVDGKLSVADNADLELTTEWILLRGELEIGTEAKPHTHKATITLTDNVPNEEIEGMGDRGVMILGGTLNLHGDRTNSWTKLARTAEEGSRSIQVLDAGVGGSATRSSSPQRISIPTRQSGEPFPASGATRSRSTGSWTTCTTAGSPTAWMSGARSAC